MDVRPARSADVPELAATLCRAFADDPVSSYMWPTAETYSAAYPRFAAALLNQTIGAGGAWVAGDGAAAAVWLASGEALDMSKLSAIVTETVSPERLAVRAEVHAQVNALKPAAPHWYLPLIGVAPERQGQGLASALLAHALARCDAQGALAYLESSNIRNVPLYERHGFVVLGVVQPADFPPLFPMVRGRR